MQQALALQLFTVRDLFAADSAATLRAVKQIGYGAVEFGGLGAWKPADIRAQLNDIGLKGMGAHIPVNRLRDDLPGVISEAQTLGLEHLTCPWLPPEQRTPEFYRTLVPILENAGRACNDAGFSFSYHHHDFELAPAFGDQNALEFFAQSIDPSLLKFEIDVYWATFAGLDPVKLLEHFGPRVALVHLKDMTSDGTRSFAEVGSGELPIPAILETAKRIGAKWAIVEQDQCQRPPLESIAMSFKYLQSLGMG